MTGCSVDPEMVEILVCKRAVQVAAEINAQKLHVELDNMAVVSMLNDSMKNLNVVGPWIEEIKGMLKDFQEAKVSWVERFANGATDSLAKVGKNSKM